MTPLSRVPAKTAKRGNSVFHVLPQQGNTCAKPSRVIPAITKPATFEVERLPSRSCSEKHGVSSAAVTQRGRRAAETCNVAGAQRRGAPSGGPQGQAVGVPANPLLSFPHQAVRGTAAPPPGPPARRPDGPTRKPALLRPAASGEKRTQRVGFGIRRRGGRTRRLLQAVLEAQLHAGCPTPRKGPTPRREGLGRAAGPELQAQAHSAQTPQASSAPRAPKNSPNLDTLERGTVPLCSCAGPGLRRPCLPAPWVSLFFPGSECAEHTDTHAGPCSFFYLIVYLLLFIGFIGFKRNKQKILMLPVLHALQMVPARLKCAFSILTIGSYVCAGI